MDPNKQKKYNELSVKIVPIGVPKTPKPPKPPKTPQTPPNNLSPWASPPTSPPIPLSPVFPSEQNIKQNQKFFPDGTIYPTIKPPPVNPLFPDGTPIYPTIKTPPVNPLFRISNPPTATPPTTTQPSSPTSPPYQLVICQGVLSTDQLQLDPLKEPLKEQT